MGNLIFPPIDSYTLPRVGVSQPILIKQVKVRQAKAETSNLFKKQHCLAIKFLCRLSVPDHDKQNCNNARLSVPVQLRYNKTKLSPAGSVAHKQFSRKNSL